MSKGFFYSDDFVFTFVDAAVLFPDTETFGYKLITEYDEFPLVAKDENQKLDQFYVLVNRMFRCGQIVNEDWKAFEHIFEVLDAGGNTIAIGFCREAFDREPLEYLRAQLPHEKRGIPRGIIFDGESVRTLLDGVRS